MILKKIWSHIRIRRRKQLGLLMILMLLASVSEVISIGAILPFLAVLSNPTIIFDHELAQPFIQLLELTEPGQLILPFTILFSLSAIITGSIRILMIWAQTRLANAIGADLSYQIYKRTLFQPYPIHVARNSSEMIDGIASKANQVVGGFIMPGLNVISVFMMMTTILAALVVLDPIVVTSMIAGFSLIYALIARFTKKRLVLNSELVSKKSVLAIKALQEGLGGIRDVLIDGSQATYIKIFRSADLPIRHAQANTTILSGSPRYGIEALGMVLIAWLAYILGDGEGDLIGPLPILGAIAIGAQRMLPMLQLAYSSWSSFRGAQVVLQDAIALLEQPLPNYAEGPTIEAIPFQQAITMEKVSFRYGVNTPWVLRDLSLEIPKGSRIGIIGTTGSGKSTLLDIIMGLLHPSEGKIAIDGMEVTDQNHRGWQSHISHIPQAIYLSDATIAENIAFGVPIEKINHQQVQFAAKQAQIAETIETWEQGYETTVGERGVRLSGGQRQRIGIARALYKQADVIIFDEATSALDNETERAVMEAIDNIQEEITILMVAHRLTTLKSCNLIIELEDGKIKRSGSYLEIVRYES
jgi:ATP-binding cassette subfamily B protein